MLTQSERVVEAVLSIVKNRHSLGSSIENLDVPVLFPKHQSRFIAFTYGVTAVTLIYGVFFMNFGSHKHCFSTIREQASRAISSFTNVQPDEQIIIEQRVKEIESQIKQVSGYRDKK